MDYLPHSRGGKEAAQAAPMSCDDESSYVASLLQNNFFIGLPLVVVDHARWCCEVETCD